MTSRLAPTAAPTSTVYRLRLDNLLLALVLCGLVAAAVPMVYASINQRSAARQAALAITKKTVTAAQVGAVTEPATTTATLTAAKAVASANALLTRGQFAAAMQLVANLSGPDADAVDASGMRNRISTAETMFNADIATMRDGAASGDWSVVVDAAREARSLAPLPADLVALTARASTELAHTTALDTAQSAFEQQHFSDSLKLARDGFARWKTTDFRDLMVTSLAAIAATNKNSTATKPASVATSAATGTPVRGGDVAVSHNLNSGTITHGPHATRPAADATRPAVAAATTGQGAHSGMVTTSALADDPAFAGVDPQLLADALRLLGPNGLAQLQAAGMKIG